MKLSQVVPALLLMAGVLCAYPLEAQQLQISGEADAGGRIRISVRMPADAGGGRVMLYRSTRAISPDDLNEIRYPITVFQLSEPELASGFVDTHAAHGVTYFYTATFSDGDDRTAFSNVISVNVDNVPLPALQDPEILIDKIHYVLEVRDGGRIVKRYPVILGRDPVTRKLHQDFRTTPEGIYRIINLKRNSTFHRALDIDYPNHIDRVRYDFLRSQGQVPQGKLIGGEIQVHGQLRNWALERNWTWGCIALRNANIEELFDHPDIAVGTPVIIVGNSIRREDVDTLMKFRTSEEIESLQARMRDLGFYEGRIDGILGPQTRIALGTFQLQKGFPITCDLDLRTVEALG